jgi:nitrate/nitrite-specific signal transduction histidine kinase
VLREALSNTARHAHASAADVELTVASMRYRADALAGRTSTAGRTVTAG